MTDAGFKGITVHVEAYEGLEELRKELGLRSVAQTVERIAEDYPEMRKKIARLERAALAAPEAR